MHSTRVRAAYALTAAALFTGIAAPAASAVPQRHGSREIPFTAAEVTAQDDGSYQVTWKAPGVRKVAVKANGRTVAAGGATGSVVVKGLRAADR
jgi:protein-tyrosine phosphatase